MAVWLIRIVVRERTTCPLSGWQFGQGEWAPGYGAGSGRWERGGDPLAMGVGLLNSVAFSLFSLRFLRIMTGSSACPCISGSVRCWVFSSTRLVWRLDNVTRGTWWSWWNRPPNGFEPVCQASKETTSSRDIRSSQWSRRHWCGWGGVFVTEKWPTHVDFICGVKLEHGGTPCGNTPTVAPFCRV